MNWAVSIIMNNIENYLQADCRQCLILGVAVFGSVLYYLLMGRRQYDGPAAYVRKLD
jgi:hypothetical protein